MNTPDYFSQSSLVIRAAGFSSVAHTGQRRKAPVFSTFRGEEPYFDHCQRVAITTYHMVPWHPMIETMVAAAYLHDTVEDTTTNFTDINREFGHAVMMLVRDLTDIWSSERFPDLNREERKSREAVRLGCIPDEAKIIKWADISDNTSDIVMVAPSFAPVYLREKARVIEKMNLHEVAKRMNELKKRMTN